MSALLQKIVRGDRKANDLGPRDFVLIRLELATKYGPGFSVPSVKTLRRHRIEKRFWRRHNEHQGGTYA